MRETNRETKENQRDKKGKMLLLFNKVDKGCVLDKGRKVITEVYKSVAKCISWRSPCVSYFVSYIILVLN